MKTGWLQSAGSRSRRAGWKRQRRGPASRSSSRASAQSRIGSVAAASARIHWHTSQARDGLRTDQDLLLPEILLQLQAPRVPPSALELRALHLIDDHIVTLRAPAGLLPQAFRRCAGVAGQTPEPLGEFVRQRVKVVTRDRTAGVVAQGQEQLDQIHGQFTDVTLSRRGPLMR